MRKVLVGFMLGVGAAALILLLGWAGGLDRVEMMSYDWRIRTVADPSRVDPDIVFVEVNDTSILAFADAVGRWPWPRVLQSEIIDFLKRGGARVIAYDIQLSEPSRGSFTFGDVPWTAEESDAAIVSSLRSAGNVIMLADATSPGLIADPSSTAAAAQAAAIPRWSSPRFRLGPAIEERPVVIAPFQELADAAAGLGHNFLALDPDGPARRMAPFIRSGDRYLPSLGVAAALAAGGFKPEEVVLEGHTLLVGDRRIPLVPVAVEDAPGSRTRHDQLTMLINYRAPALQPNGDRPYTSYEARHLVLSEEQIVAGMKPDIDPAVFRNKIVFVGLTASGLVDVFPTPFSNQGTMPGIQLHASIADSILSHAFITPARDWSRSTSTIATAVLVGLMAAILPFVVAALGSALAACAWTALCVWAFRRGLWLNMIQPLAAMGLALFAGTAYRYFVEDREKRVVKKLFGRYVSRDVFVQLTAHPELAELGGKRREMTVLFSDIRGFTSVTEKGNPEELVAQLNEYFSRMVDIVFRHKGTVDKFVGDMVMALFGAPLDDPDHADHAIQASIDMVLELGELNRSWAERGMAQLDIGVGINSGEMIAGNIGSSSIMSYTVIGDNVNLGARLESLNKDYRTRIIMSDATRTRLTKEYESRPLGDVTVKGKSKAVAIYEIIVPAPFATNEEHPV